MTKLPKPLEQMIQNLEVPAYQSIGTEIALEVLQRAEKLVEALKPIVDSGLFTNHPTLNHMLSEAKNALADWQQWKEGK